MTIEKRLELISLALRYCIRAKAAGMPSSCYAKSLREPVFFLWELRNTKNKMEAAEYRSEASKELKYGKGLVVYDHSIPFRYLQNELLSMSEAEVSSESIRPILQRLCVSCILTKDEDGELSRSGLNHKMPDNWDQEDPLARYKQVKIDVIRNPAFKRDQSSN